MIFLLFSSGCSTKKKSWVNRQFHNTTAKYNGYFNGNESIKNGIRKLDESFVDDYTTILPVFKTGDLKKSKSIHSYMDKAIRKKNLCLRKRKISQKHTKYNYKVFHFKNLRENKFEICRKAEVLPQI